MRITAPAIFNEKTIGKPSPTLKLGMSRRHREPLILRGPFIPSHDQNRLKHEGDIGHAREFYEKHKPANLRFLLQKRFSWMNEYCDGKAMVIEVGAGAAFSKLFIRNPNFITTDCEKFPWIDNKVDALDTNLPSQSVDVVISSHMVHHLARPRHFFSEMHRILKPGGYLLIQEVENSLLMRLMLRIMRHEGWSYDADVFDETYYSKDAADPWSGNCAVPQILFSDSRTFERRIPGFKVVKNQLSECLIFPLSGGVIAKAKTFDLPLPLLKAFDALDNLLIELLPSVFALGRSVVLEKI